MALTEGALRLAGAGETSVRQPRYRSERKAIVMTKSPPAPPANRSPNDPGSNSDARPDVKNDGKPPERKNLAEQGRQGNIKQNTTNQGYQQDR
jgi:hypothetical protein